jgi:hypothetical protein
VQLSKTSVGRHWNCVHFALSHSAAASVPILGRPRNTTESYLWKRLMHEPPANPDLVYKARTQG